MKVNYRIMFDLQEVGDNDLENAQGYIKLFMLVHMLLKCHHSSSVSRYLPFNLNGREKIMPTDQKKQGGNCFQCLHDSYTADMLL